MMEALLLPIYSCQSLSTPRMQPVAATTATGGLLHGAL